MDNYKVEFMSQRWKGWYEAARFETYDQAKKYVDNVFRENAHITHSSITSLTEAERK